VWDAVGYQKLSDRKGRGNRAAAIVAPVSGGRAPSAPALHCNPTQESIHERQHADGHIVTNNHVVDGADNDQVMLRDGAKFKAQVVGRDDKTDLALLKIDADRPLPYVALDDSAKPRVGDWVLAVGNPFGLVSRSRTGR
jgi:hypothetical protein